jgi:hypothetical protein
MLRRLLNFASVLCLIACVALMGMWVRSYNWTDELTTRLGSGHGLEVQSTPGRLSIDQFSLASPSVWPWTLRSEPIHNKWQMFDLLDLRRHFGFAGSFQWSRKYIVIPYWFAILAMGSPAILFQLRWTPWRFTLRSMFALTTFLAVVLGMIAWLDRAWIGK